MEHLSFNFYGARRHNIAGVHPSERVMERVECSAEDTTGLYRAVQEQAQRLLEIWPEQDAILVHECDGSREDDFFVYRKPAGSQECNS